MTNHAAAAHIRLVLFFKTIISTRTLYAHIFLIKIFAITVVVEGLAGSANVSCCQTVTLKLVFIICSCGSC